MSPHNSISYCRREPVTHITRVLFVTALALLATTCAKVIAPPGGPEDKTPPVILTAEPHSHQTKTPPGNTFTVTFSENIDPRSVAKQFFVTPRQAMPPKLKVRGAKLTAIFVDSFSVDQTYVITVGSGVRDRHGNQLGSSSIFAFTRGEEIDTGHVAGIVTDGDSPAGNVGVALYRKFTPEVIGDLDSLYPDYFTVSGSDGAFELAFLPVDDYFILAFRDKDKNQLFQYGVEDFGVTTRPLHVGGASADNLELRMQSSDTTQPSILSTTFSSDGLLRVNLTRKIKPDILAGHLDHVLLLNATDSSVLSFPLALKNAHGKPAKRFEFYFANLQPGDYLLEIDFAAMYTDGRSDSARFAPITRDSGKDTNRPKLTERNAPTFIAPWEPLHWTYTFSEPITLDSAQDIGNSDSSLATVALTDTRKRQLNYIVRPAAPSFALQFSTSLHPIRGEQYTLTLNPQRVKDVSGNSLTDSTISDSIMVWPSDSLGSLKLGVDNRFDSLYDGRYYLKMSRLGDRTFWTTTDSPDSTRVELPAGDYLVEVLLDTSAVSVGSLYPLRYAIPRAFYPDTVHVRPRFDTEGINIVVE